VAADLGVRPLVHYDRPTAAAVAPEIRHVSASLPDRQSPKCDLSRQPERYMNVGTIGGLARPRP
jgi:hypothetical protein